MIQPRYQLLLADVFQCSEMAIIPHPPLKPRLGHGDEAFQQSSPPFPSSCFRWCGGHFPRSLHGDNSGFGLHCGVQPFYTPMWFGTKIYFTSSPSWQWLLQIFIGKTKKNRLSALLIGAWKSQLRSMPLLSQRAPPRLCLAQELTLSQ